MINFQKSEKNYIGKEIIRRGYYLSWCSDGTMTNYLRTSQTTNKDSDETPVSQECTKELSEIYILNLYDLQLISI